MVDALPDNNKFSFLKVFIFFGAGLLIFTILGNTYLYFFTHRQITAPASLSKITPVPAIASPLSPLPFSFSDSLVSGGGVAYQLQGKVWRVEKKGKFFSVIIEGKDGKVYSEHPFLIEENAPFAAATPLDNQQNKTTVSFTEIKVGDSLRIYYYFDFQKAAGYVTKVEAIK